MAKTDEKRIVDANAEAGIITVSSRPIVKIGLAHPFQIVGGDVYTYLDILKHRATMVERTYGVEVTVKNKLNGPEARTKMFVVPWPNVTYVLYGE